MRTILQDAWATVAHHLYYKKEADVPKKLQRKLNALSGLFETADDQFESLRIARNQYIVEAEKEISTFTKESLNQPINLDDLIAYVGTKFPNRLKLSIESTASLLDELKKFGYTNLSKLDQTIDKAYDAVLQYEKDYPPTEKNSDKETTYAAIGFIRTALGIVDENYCGRNMGKERTNRSKNISIL